MGPRTVLMLLMLLGGQIWESTGEATLTQMVGKFQEQITLPCSTVAQGVTNVAWYLDNSTKEVLGCDNANSSDSRFSRINVTSLLITRLLMSDEGFYGCKDCLQSAAAPLHIQLHVTSAPYNVSFRIYPTYALHNGTLYIPSGSNISFACASPSNPPPNLKIVLDNQYGNPELLDDKNTSFLLFSLANIGSNYNGNYTCSAENPTSGKTLSSTRQLLVYHPPLFSMQCSVNNTGIPLELAISCRWPNGYPDPILVWETDGKTMLDVPPEAIVNGSMFNTRQKLTCRGKHIIGKEIKEETCQVTLGHPMPQSQPLRTCLAGENVTLSCTVSGANPPARITWLHNISNPEVEMQSGSKYQIIYDGSNSFLTIMNCSKDRDEGTYICKAENGLAVKEIYVSLEVTMPRNIVGLVSGLLILFLLVVGLITGIIVYCDPWVYWKANPFRSGQSEVLVLVDSEEEDDLEPEQNPVDNSYTDTVATDSANPPAANGNLYKHEVLFHDPPNNISPALVIEVSEDREGENQVNNSSFC